MVSGKYVSRILNVPKESQTRGQATPLESFGSLRLKRSVPSSVSACLARCSELESLWYVRAREVSIQGYNKSKPNDWLDWLHLSHHLQIQIESWLLMYVYTSVVIVHAAI